MGTKAHIRKEILQKRNQLLFTEQVDKSKAITEFLVNMKAFIESDFILLYENYKNEVMTNDIFKIAVSAGKKVAYPRVDGDDMDFYVVNTKAQLHEGYKGIFEPDEGCEIVDTEDISLHNVFMILPGAAFDRLGNRIGYGKGFYDKYLDKMPYIKTVALAYELQIADEIPYETHDRQVEYIVTENRIIECKKRE